MSPPQNNSNQIISGSPKVEYSLTQHGESLKPIMLSIREWGHDHLHIQEN